MDIRQNNNDSTVYPASRMMTSNAVNAEIFSALANHDLLLYRIIEILEELEIKVHHVEERQGNLEYDLANENDNLKTENICFKQMVAGNSPNARSVQDCWESEDS